jgi:uncharacterized alkaline shock family protein YloU
MAGPVPTHEGSGPVPVARLHVADEVIAAIAAHHALATPEVTALRPRVGQALADLARSHAGDDTGEAPTGGVSVDRFDATTASIEVDLAVRLGAPCPSVARHVQERVADHVRTSTGVRSVVSVSIVDVTEEPDDGPGPDDRTVSAEPDPAEPDPAGQETAEPVPVGQESAEPDPAGQETEADPADRDTAGLPARLAAVIEGRDDTRLWVAPPFDRFPPLPGRPPAGVVVDDDTIRLHLGVTRADIVDLAQELDAALAAAVAGNGGPDPEIHLHVDRFDGNPFAPPA